MRVLYLDCGMGIAGDMLMGALYECLPNKDDFWDIMNALQLPNVKIIAENSSKCGISCTQMKVIINGEEEKSLDEHNIRNTVHIDHDSHVREHQHFHRTVADIEEIVSGVGLNECLKEQVLSVYREIAQAESKVHGKPVEQIHFHEVGNLDAIADIIGNLVLVDLLKVDKIIASPINVGYGKVACAHGILPVPAPATVEILKGIPAYAGNYEGEMCTPTGAALYKAIVDQINNMPVMSIESVGYGCGKKDFPAANVVRAVIGEIDEESDHIIELSCNLDDMTAEDIALAAELLLLHGALDVYTTPIQMKKNRPGTMLSVLCREQQKKELGELIFKHTTTIGIREYSCDRMVLNRNRHELDTPFGTMHYKESYGYGVTKIKIEFEDLKQAVEKYEKSIQEIRSEIERLL